MAAACFAGCQFAAAAAELLPGESLPASRSKEKAKFALEQTVRVGKCSALLRRRLIEKVATKWSASCEEPPRLKGKRQDGEKRREEKRRGERSTQDWLCEQN